MRRGDCDPRDGVGGSSRGRIKALGAIWEGPMESLPQGRLMFKLRHEGEACRGDCSWCRNIMCKETEEHGGGESRDLKGAYCDWQL